MGTYSIYTLIAFHGIALILGYYCGHLVRPGVHPLPENRLATGVLLLSSVLLPWGTTAFFVGFLTGNRVAEEELEDEEADRVAALVSEAQKAKSNVRQ